VAKIHRMPEVTLVCRKRATNHSFGATIELFWCHYRALLVPLTREPISQKVSALGHAFMTVSTNTAKMLQPGNSQNQEIKIPLYLAAQVQIKKGVLFEFVPRNLMFLI